MATELTVLLRFEDDDPDIDAVLDDIAVAVDDATDIEVLDVEEV